MDSSDKAWIWTGRCFAATEGHHVLIVRPCPNTRPTDEYRWEFVVDGRPQRRVKTWRQGIVGAMETLDNPVAMERIRKEKFKGYRTSLQQRWGRRQIQTR